MFAASSLQTTQLRKMPSPQNVRRLVLTGAVTSITIAGTLYGAGLKTNEEISEVSRTFLSQSSDLCTLYTACFKMLLPLSLLVSDSFQMMQNTRKRQEATMDEKIAALQGMRSNLTARKGMLETQIRDLDARIQEKQQRAAAGSDKERPQSGR